MLMIFCIESYGQRCIFTIQRKLYSAVMMSHIPTHTQINGLQEGVPLDASYSAFCWHTCCRAHTCARPRNHLGGYQQFLNLTLPSNQLPASNDVHAVPMRQIWITPSLQTVISAAWQ
jgi:hypothetical protein